MDATIAEILNQLANMRHESVIKRYEKNGEQLPYYGVLLGQVNKIAKQYAKQSELAIPLWRTNYLEAQLIAVQLLSPQKLTFDIVDELLNSQASLTVMDKFMDRVVSQSSLATALRHEWFKSDDKQLQRFAWRLTVIAVQQRQLQEEEVATLVNEIEQTLGQQEEPLRWVMNQCFVEIAVKYETFRQSILKAAEQIGARTKT